MNSSKSPNSSESPGIDRHGTWWQRMLIWVFSCLLSLLVYWLLGFVMGDIDRFPGPNWQEFEVARLDSELRTAGDELHTELADVNRQIENQRRRQQLLRDGTASSQKTLGHG